VLNALFTAVTIAVLSVLLAPIQAFNYASITHANAPSTSRVMPANGASLKASIAHNLVRAGGLGSGIEADGSPAVGVALGHHNVVALHPYFGITPGPGSLSVNPEFVSSTDFHLHSEMAGSGQIEMDIYVKQ
jgi:hypothetical protein